MASTAAEDWWLHCPRCGHWARTTEHGVVRVGARSVGKRVPARCSGCGRYRLVRLVAQPPGWRPPATDRARTSALNE